MYKLIDSNGKHHSVHADEFSVQNGVLTFTKNGNQGPLFQELVICFSLFHVWRWYHLEDDDS